jgi:hypothetical protein
VSCGTPDRLPRRSSFPYGILTLCDGAFQHLRVGLAACHGLVHYPARVLPPVRFGLFPVRSPLLRESRLISFRQATEMFQFACRPPPSLCIQEGVSRHHSGGVAPFGISRIVARMQLPLNVSPVSASFIGMTRPGIHRERCPAWHLPGRHHVVRASGSRVMVLFRTASSALGKIEVIISIFLQLFRYTFLCAPILCHTLADLSTAFRPILAGKIRNLENFIFPKNRKIREAPARRIIPPTPAHPANACIR